MQHGKATLNTNSRARPTSRIPAVYVRASTIGDVSIVRQRELVRQFADDHGWTISDDLTFIDNGVGRASFDRPAWRRMRELMDSPATRRSTSSWSRPWTG
jgi:hypothetical protein